MDDRTERSADWMAQAERDLAAATAVAGLGHHEWACFMTQHAAVRHAGDILDFARAQMA